MDSEAAALGWLGVPLAILSGAIRVGTPFLFVSLGECITEKGGRVNVGQEGILMVGAMAGFATSYMTGSPWVGVLAAGGAGLLLGVLHAAMCSAPRVNDISIGIALMLFGTGVAFFFGKPFPHLDLLNPSLIFRIGFFRNHFIGIGFRTCNPRPTRGRGPALWFK